MPTQIYDDLDILYRAIWGHSLHHGCWEADTKSPQEAKENLIQKSLNLLKPTGHVADIGCGYGVLAHRLISQHHCSVTACTSSTKQAQQIPTHPSLQLLVGDWLQQTIPPSSLDSAIAIESISHFSDLDALFSQLSSALKPGARFVIADWYSNKSSSFYLRHLAKNGDLPNWRPFSALLETASRNQFIPICEKNISHQVDKTWSALFYKSLTLPFRRPQLLPLILRNLAKRPALLWAFPLLKLAYLRGDLDYRLVTFTKEGRVSPRPSP